MFGLDTIRAMNRENNPQRPPKSAWKRTDGRKPDRRPASDIMEEQRRLSEFHRAGFRAGKHEGLMVALGELQRQMRNVNPAINPAVYLALETAERRLQAALFRSLP